MATKETRPGGAKKVRTKSIIDEVREAREEKKERRCLVAHPENNLLVHCLFGEAST